MVALFFALWVCAMFANVAMGVLDIVCGDWPEALLRLALAAMMLLLMCVMMS